VGWLRQPAHERWVLDVVLGQGPERSEHLRLLADWLEVWLAACELVVTG
jgi:hypothetical protein